MPRDVNGNVVVDPYPSYTRVGSITEIKNGQYIVNKEDKQFEDSELQKAARDIMCHDWKDHVMALLYDRITNPKTQLEYKQFNKPKRNPLVRIASINTVVFSRETYRGTDRKTLNTDYYKYVELPDLAFSQAEYTTNCMGDCFLMPYWDTLRKQVRHEVILPTQVFHIEMMRSTPKSITISYDSRALAEIVNVDYAETPTLFVRWMYDGTYQIYKDSGLEHRVGGGDSGYGEMPLVWFSLGTPSQVRPWSVYMVKDLIDGTVEVGWLELLYNRTAFRRSYRQPSLDPNSAVGPSQGKIDQIAFGPNEVNKVPLTFQQTVDESTQYLESIERQEAYLAATRGISSNAYFQRYEKDSVSSISAESRQVWKKAVKRFIAPERDYMRLTVKAMNKYAKTSHDPEINWILDHIEPIPELDDPMQAHKLLVEQSKTGTDNAVNWLLRQHPELQTFEAAKKQVIENLEIRGELIEYNVERNIPNTGDMPQGVNTVEENGRSGGVASGIVRSATGADGANVVPDNQRDTNL